MRIETESAKRLGIFFFYDKDGIVDDYVIYMLRDMMPIMTRNIIVCNGELTQEGRRRFESLGDVDILVRKNDGFDVWAYKSALEYYGWETVDQFDEVIMYNFTIMGPVYPFMDMFREMDARDLDFWGMTIHNGAPFDPWGNLQGGRIPVHIQSHFIAVRNNMVRSREFHDYWDNRPMIKRYEDAVGLHEAIFTQTFEKLGYQWDVYVDTDDLIDKTFYPLFNMPVDMIKNRKCPIFKRKLFINDFAGAIQENANLCGRELFDYLKEHTEYDTDMILGHLLRTANLSDLINGLNLKYILDENKQCSYPPKAKVGLFVNANDWEKSALDCLELLKDIPSEVNLCLVPASDERSILSAYGEKLVEYDIVGIIDAYGVDKSRIFSNVIANRRKLYTNMLGGSDYINQIIELFIENKRLGMLVPERNPHGEYYSMYSGEWQVIFKKIKSSLEDNSIDVLISKDKQPPFAEGNCMWIRGDIIRKWLTDINITSQIHSKKLVNTKLMESYLLPLVGQSLGYYTASVSTVMSAQNTLLSFAEYTELRNQNQKVQRGSFTESVARKDIQIKAEVYFDTGDGFKTNAVQNIKYTTAMYEKDSVIIKVKLPEKQVRHLRFDPCEGFMCLCSGITCDIPDAVIHNTNGIRFGKEDLFLTKDPQYVIEGDFSQKKTVCIKMKNISLFWAEKGLDKDMEKFFNQREELVKSVEYLTNEYNRQLSELKALQQKYDEKNEELNSMVQSKSWRYTSWLRKKK